MLEQRGVLAGVEEACEEMEPLAREDARWADAVERLRRAIHVAKEQLCAQEASQDDMMLERTASLHAFHSRIMDAVEDGLPEEQTAASTAIRAAEQAEAALATLLRVERRDGSQIGQVLAKLFDGPPLA